MSGKHNKTGIKGLFVLQLSCDLIASKSCYNLEMHSVWARFNWSSEVMLIGSKKYRNFYFKKQKYTGLVTIYPIPKPAVL